MSTPLRVGVAGLGTIGGGTVRLLRENADLITARCGRPVTVVAVAERDRERAASVDIGDAELLDDGLALAGRDDVDVVVELIGGHGGIALNLARQALQAEKHVVTANKAMIAHHGQELASAAEASGVTLAFEAAVAGGIPILKAIRESLAANRIRRVYGIFNGTCNYILTVMRDSGRPFADILAEAQALGYAEADPTFDVDGIDAAHKTAILAALAFGRRVDLHAVRVAGIRDLSPVDQMVAAELGYCVKLLGVAEDTGKGLVQRVEPCLVAADSPVARVDGVFNAVVVDADFVDRTVYQGRGAGAEPTASAVVGDLIDIARSGGWHAFGLPAESLGQAEAAPAEALSGRFYLRFAPSKREDATAGIAAALHREGVSIDNLFGDRAPGAVIVTTAPAEGTAVARACAATAGAMALAEAPVRMRIEEF